jgi:hypothetical protein
MLSYVEAPKESSETTRPLVRRDMIQDPYRVVKHCNGFLEYPEHWPRYVNGTGEPCDMLQGPCCCGAWHELSEWTIDVGGGK